MGVSADEVTLGPEDSQGCFKQSWDDFNLKTCFDVTSQELVFEVDQPDDSWFSIGFGNTMSNTDMISWSVNNGKGKARDLWSTNYSAPIEDENSDLVEAEEPSFDSDSKRMTFVTRRPLDTGDTEQDYLVPLS